MSRFRGTSPDRSVVEIEVDGARMLVPAGRSLLASLLVDGTSPVPFFCAIGQCMRCEVLIDGRRTRSCLYYPRGGETIRSLTDEGRAAESV